MNEEESIHTLDDLEVSLDVEIHELEIELSEIESRLSIASDLRDSVSEMDIDEFLGHAAIASADEDIHAAIDAIINSMAASTARAKYCVSFGNSRLAFSGSNFVNRIFSQEVDEDIWIDLAERLVSFSLTDYVGHGTMKISKFTEPFNELWEYLTDEDAFSDSTTSLASSVLASGAVDDVAELVKLVPNLLPYDDEAIEDMDTKILSSIYSFNCLRNEGLVFSNGRVKPEYGAETLLLSPWILPFSADTRTDGLEILLDALADLELAVCAPEDELFDFTPSVDWVEDVRNTAAFLFPQLTREISEVSYFSNSKIQIVLVERNSFVYAWVGVNGTGVILGFDPESFVVVGMPSPAMGTAAGCAISFYVDRKIRLNREIPGMSHSVIHQYRGQPTVYKYLPQPSFQRNVKDVARGEHAPPRAHYVAPHIRHLTGRRPNPDHVALAPVQLQLRMGSGDTWVHGHARGSNNIGEIKLRLSRYSMLADSLGQLF